MKKRSHIIVTFIAFTFTFGSLVAAKGAVFMHHNKYNHCEVVKGKKEPAKKQKVAAPIVEKQVETIQEDTL